MLRFALVLLALTAVVHAEPRRIPFWPDSVPAAIQARVDGAAVLDAVRSLSRHHRVQGSRGYRAAADWLGGELRAAGLADAAVESLPADGKTRYGHFKSYLGWSASEGLLEEPGKAPIADFTKLPVALADYSQDADVTAEVVAVAHGNQAIDYERIDVRGKLVLADGGLPAVHRLAVEERGAVGILSYYPNQRTAWSGLDTEQIRWGHLSAYQTKNRFAFMLSRRQAQELQDRLGRGETVRLHARVRARMVPASYDIVSATIPGTDPAAGEIVLTAHLCHQSAGANDNASGSAALLGIARALRAAVAAGDLPPPRRTIRFLWLPEIAGSQAWLIRHPEIVRRLRAGIHMDMVGGRPEITHAALHLSRSAASLPHVVNEIARAWLEEVARGSTRYAETGSNLEGGFVWPPGSRDALVADFRPIEMGSDHQVFQDATFAVPMVYFHDWPDVTIHTSKDVPDNLDPTKLGRVVYMGAGIAWTLAALPDAEAGRLAPLARAAVDEERAAARRAEANGRDPEDARLAEREAVVAGLAELATIAALWPGTAAEVRRQAEELAKAAPRPTRRHVRDARVPVRSPELRGPLDIYYYDHLEAVLGPHARPALLDREQGELIAYEALNLVDGKRSVSDIRDILTGRYLPVALADVTAWLELLAQARAVTWRK